MTMTPERWRLVRALFDQALEQTSELRAEWISSATVGDPALKAEVESLLAALEEERDRFERHPLPLGDLGPELDPPGPTVGARVGPYRLVRQVGEGGMGVVFEAYRDDDHYRKRVAIKTIARSRDRDLILRRFRYERQILARLEHRNIAVLLDGGIAESGQPYFAMEYIEGQPIDRYCDAARLGLRQRLQLFRQVCAAVAYAHQNLVVHRDLKPTNILVTADGTVKLLDFGIAKLLREDDGSDGEGLTQPGVTPLTTAYASPEQLRGEAVTTASDVFSLGLVLFKLLAGRHPFAADLPGQAELRRRICETNPVLPSLSVTEQSAPGTDAGGTRRLQRALQGDLDSIVLMALRKEQARRYRSVEQLSEDILRYLAGLPVSAQPDSAGYRLRKLLRRNRPAVAGAAAAVLILITGLAGTLWQAGLARQERDRARLEAVKATRVTDFVQGMLGSADPRARGRDITIAEALADAERKAEAELAGEPEILAAVLSTIGRTYHGLGRYPEAERGLTRALALERGLDAAGDRPGVITGLRQLAALEADRGRLAEADTLVAEALARARRPPLDSARLGELLDASGQLQIDRGEFPAAERTLREAVAILRGGHGARQEATASALNNLGVTLGQQNRMAEAVPLHLEALSLLRAAKGPEHPDVASGLNTLANAYTILGNYRAADTLFQQALAQRIRLLGPHHSEVAWTHYSYADMLRLAGEFARAIPEARAVLAGRGPNLPDTHPMVHSALQVLGRSLLSLGRLREAETALRESLRLRRAAYPAGHWLVASAAGSVGECLLAARNYAAAEPLLLDGYRTVREAKGQQDQRVRDLAGALARLYDATGRQGEAAKYRS
jgi:serine/threonine-protein kinase